MPRHAFISHSHKDSAPAELILSALESRGIKCWTAPRDVSPGGSYAESILTAIENSSCFVLVYTQHSNVSPHVLREVERALTIGINIIPIRFDDSLVSKSLNYLLATVHWLSAVADPSGLAIGRAAERIALCVTSADETAAPSVMRAPDGDAMPSLRTATAVGTTRVSRSVVALLALCGVGCAVLLIIAFFGLRGLWGQSDARETSVHKGISALPPSTPVSILRETQSQRTAPASPAAVELDSLHGSSQPNRPTATRSASASTPISAVRDYFDCLERRDVSAAYELLSPELRDRQPLVQFEQSFASTASVHLIEARQLATGDASATVSVSFDKENVKFGRIQWRGPIQLVSTSSGWRIDSLRDVKAVPRRR